MFHIIINIKNDRYNNKLCQPNEYLPHYIFHRYLFNMRLSLLNILKEEIKEQGYGSYMQDLKLPSGQRLGDISGFDFEKNKVIKKDSKEIQPKIKTINEPEVASNVVLDTNFEIDGDLSALSVYPDKGKPLTNDKYFVLHHVGGRGNADGVINTLNTREEGVFGVQWIIDREGRIFRGLPAGSKGSHIKSGRYLRGSAPKDISNETTQGVEIIAKDDNDVLPLQCFSAFKLVKELGYPLSNIYGHGEINTHKQITEGQKCKTFIKDNWDLSIDEVAEKVENN